MAAKTWETGLLLQEFPYIKMGNGPHTMLVIPGTLVDNVDPSWIVKNTYQAAFANFARNHTLYLVNRKRNLPIGYTSAQMAADYVRVLHEIGPARVMGLSAGGMIAQEVAHQAPAFVEKMALVVAAARLSDAGRRFAHLLIELAEAGRWVDIEAELAAGLFVSPRAQRIMRRIMQIGAKPFVAPPQYGHDFVTTLRADLAFDSHTLLPTLHMPTLILGGGSDPFFPAALLRETADLIPNATLTIYEGAGHGLVKMQKRRFETDVLKFFDPHLAPAVA